MNRFFYLKCFSILFISYLYFSCSSSVSSNPNGNATTVLNFAPSTGSFGTLVTLDSPGLDLLNPQSVTIGGVPGLIVGSTATSVKALSLSAVSGAVSITLSNGSAVTSSGLFSFAAAGPIATELGGLIVGTGEVGSSIQGWSVDVSADGNIIVSGSYTDNSNAGAAWIFEKNGSTWIQQGTKLTGSDAIGPARFGNSVAMSADGSIVVVGGPFDNGQQGAVWVFSKVGSAWVQQGSKLVGTGAVGNARQGSSVAISGSGNTIVVGGPRDNSSEGAFWIFERSGVTWVQQGTKLRGTGSGSAAQQGLAVSISADGMTIAASSLADSNGEEAAWIFAKNGSTWAQQGSKLMGTGAAAPPADFGSAIDLSADGSTLVVGGRWDNSNIGATWIFNRVGTTWSQQGSKLVGTGVTGATALQGWSVAISADGNTVLVGGAEDASDTGAFWVFVRTTGVWAQSGLKKTSITAGSNNSFGQALNLSLDAKTAVISAPFMNSGIGGFLVFTP